jgi:glycosyltransferase involved in cell wall biosynthesis
MRLLASMIVRNEADRYQPALAAHSLQYVDAIRLLDDGSTDETADLIQALDPERVQVMRNRTSRWDAEGEGAARQQLLEWSLAYGADWILGIDGDEVVPEGVALRERLEKTSPEVEVLSLRMVEVWDRRRIRPVTPAWMSEYAAPHETADPWGIRVDGGWAPRDCGILWRPPPRSMSAEEAWRLGWTIPDRRLACGRGPEIVRHLNAIPSRCDILHLGWSNPAEREGRHRRYVEIDGGEFHASAHIRSIMEEPTLEPYPAPAGLRL